MKTVTPYSTEVFSRVIAMPNLSKPITSPEHARLYKKQLLKISPSFTPLIPCYLQENTLPETILKGHENGDFFAVKYYPRGATTKSHLGVANWKACAAVFDAMSEINMPLLIHGEVTDPQVDIFDREKLFIQDILIPLIAQHPKLKIVLEHLTSAHAVNFVSHADTEIAATITAHHLVLNRTHILEHGLHPHRFCYPVAKTEYDRQALRRAATSGNPRFMLGTDSAPHTLDAKHQHTISPGIFSSPIALPLYAQVFAEEHALDKLEAFASINGPQFHKLPLNTKSITLKAIPPQDNPSYLSLSETPANTKKPKPHLSLAVFQPPIPLQWSLSSIQNKNPS
jgi:dihydroorotase